MGCIQSKTVERPKGKEVATTSNGVSSQSYKHSHSKTKQNGIDLDMRSPRDDESGLSNENIGFAEDLHAVTSLPDVITISSKNDRNGTLSVSNVSIKPSASAHSSRVFDSRNNGQLSIEELDTDFDDFSQLRPDASRYIHRQGDRINPCTTDVLLPRRKETPFPPADRPAKHVKMPGVQTVPLAINEESDNSIEIENASGTHKKSKKKKKTAVKKNKPRKQKVGDPGSSDTPVEPFDEFSSIEGTIKIDDAAALTSLLDNQIPSSSKGPSTEIVSEPVNKANTESKTITGFRNSVDTDNVYALSSATEADMGDVLRNNSNDTVKKYGNVPTSTTNVSKVVDTDNVYAFTAGPIKNTDEEVKPSKKVTEATREIVQDYLKETDVVKVGVNSVFQNDMEREKARQTRKRKRSAQSAHKENRHRQTPGKRLDNDPEHSFRETERQDTPSVQIRPGSKTSFISIASMPRFESSENIFDASSVDMGELKTENTLDAFDDKAKLIDLDDDDDGAYLDETMDDRSVHSTASLKSSYGIKPYKTSIPQALDQDKCSVRDIRFDVPVGSSSTSINKTKEKLLYSRHARQPRPMSESVLRLAGKPPLPPSMKPARPQSDTVPRGMHSYSRYMGADTDLF